MLHKKEGILPEALLNYIVRLGWSHGNDEVISREQMTEWFDFDHVGNTSACGIPRSSSGSTSSGSSRCPWSAWPTSSSPFVTDLGITATDAQLQLAVKAFRERAASLKEMAEKAAPYFKPGVTFDEKAATKFLTADSKPHLLAVQEKLKTTPNDRRGGVDGWVKEISEKAAVGMGKVAQPLRVAVTGGTVSPGIGDTVCLIGREESSDAGSRPRSPRSDDARRPGRARCARRARSPTLVERLAALFPGARSGAACSIIVTTAFT